MPCTRRLTRPDISKVNACVFRPEKAQRARFTSLYRNFTEAHGKVYQRALMKENVHRDAHALTSLMFAPSVMFS